MACLGMGGWESRKHSLRHELDFPNVDTSQRIIVNWDKAMFYLIPHIPYHNNRQQVLEMLQRDEGKMI